MREGLAGQALEDRAAVESARESRAASAMQMVAEELQPSEGTAVFLSALQSSTRGIVTSAVDVAS